MIRRVAKALLPQSVQMALRNRVRDLRMAQRDRFLRRHLGMRPLRIVIGAGGVFEPGWIPTDAEQLNLLRPESWAKYFAPDSIDALLAEHVWEHLTLEEGRRAAAICYRYLKPGGYIRIAVPDGLHPDPAYREYIKPGGEAGGPVGGHQVAYSYRELSAVFEAAGFVTELLEYHDEAGQLHVHDWNPADGMIHRSVRFDERGAVSIVLDARKAS
ncbi:MAG TPA: methyltransferase domain-containing protein [Polyangiaceae bacterium]|nr:methyltransferase domain-containing protein [Polyangiaceae bacterium]